MFWGFFFTFSQTQKRPRLSGENCFFFNGHPLPEIKDKKISTYDLKCLNNTEIELLQ